MVHYKAHRCVSEYELLICLCICAPHVHHMCTCVMCDCTFCTLLVAKRSEMARNCVCGLELNCLCVFAAKNLQRMSCKSAWCTHTCHGQLHVCVCVFVCAKWPLKTCNLELLVFYTQCFLGMHVLMKSSIYFHIQFCLCNLKYPFPIPFYNQHSVNF